MSVKRLLLAPAAFVPPLAGAQTPAAMQRLRAAYGFVAPFDGGLAVVCRNGASEPDSKLAKGRG